MLVIGDGARVQAEINAGTVIINGTVEGNVRAAQLIELHAPARVKGSLESGKQRYEVFNLGALAQKAPAVARLPRVRQILIAQQREMGQGGGVVMEGRDIGTVVFPDADVKVYLDASPEERARRRAFDPAHAAGKGAAAVSEVATALAARDRSDSTRPTSPLAQAADAVRIDTTGLSIEDVVSRVLALVEQRSRM